MLLVEVPSSDDAFQGVATTLEQFLQTASLGEFETRLQLIAAFG